MKTLQLVATVVIAMVMTAAADEEKPGQAVPPPVPNGEQVGRFVIVTATINNEQTILRLDTATGKAWKLVSTAGTLPTRQQMPLEAKGVLIQGWFEIPESFARMMEMHQQLKQDPSK